MINVQFDRVSIGGLHQNQFKKTRSARGEDLYMVVMDAGTMTLVAYMSPTVVRDFVMLCNSTNNNKEKIKFYTKKEEEEPILTEFPFLMQYVLVEKALI